MELEDSIYSLADSDLDLSFTSVASSSTTTTISARSSLARSSLTLSFNSSSSHPRPHRRHDNPHWAAINTASTLSSSNSLHLRHLRLIRLLGAGDLGRVFLCRLRDHDNSPEFALKVVDRDALTARKLSHVQTECSVLSSLDHPFLPTLYARLEASHYTCLLIDYCPNGDLHSLLRKQAPLHRLPVHTVRFYAAEILLALEYLHANGVVYRDLKPENVLICEDGHVMLSDFDLCFKSDVLPKLNRRTKENLVITEFIAEPTSAFSKSCVGTHEYLSPELVNGDGHGNGVDWWAFGVLIYELLHGTTPFKGGSKEATLRNIAAFDTKGVRFHVAGGDRGAEEAKDLIEKLLVKDPKRRLGCDGGATDIKRHAFFKGINWPLMRNYRPPEVRGVVVKRSGNGGAPPRWRRRFWKRVRCLMGVKGSKCRLNPNPNYYTYVN